jgi:hypothetical protein
MTDQLLFDKLAYMDRLKRAGLSEDHARAHAEAMEEALRESVATKADIAGVKHEIAIAVRDLTIRIGGIAIALFAALASIRFSAG